MKEKLDEKNKIVIAEFFATSTEREVEFCNKLGINYIIGEGHTWQGSYSASGYRNHLKYLNRFGRKVGPLTIYFDQTHDNNSYFEENRETDILPLLGHMFATKMPIGSTLGFDELYKKKFETCEREIEYQIEPVKSEPEIVTKNIPHVFYKELTEGNFLFIKNKRII